MPLTTEPLPPAAHLLGRKCHSSSCANWKWNISLDGETFLFGQLFSPEVHVCFQMSRFCVFINFLLQPNVRIFEENLSSFFSSFPNRNENVIWVWFFALNWWTFLQLQGVKVTYSPVLCCTTASQTDLPPRLHLLGVNWRPWHLTLKLSLSQKYGRNWASHFRTILGDLDQMWRL